MSQSYGDDFKGRLVPSMLWCQSLRCLDRDSADRQVGPTRTSATAGCGDEHLEHVCFLKL